MAPAGSEGHIRRLALRYDTHDADNSARRLILTLRPEWQSDDSVVEFVRFTDGITNTLLKAVNKKVGLTSEEVDREAILLRAYGNGTDVLIDRQREAQNHELLMHYGLAPQLLARFENGMLYRFIRGTVTRPEDMRHPEISLAIGRRLAQWHAVVPCTPTTHANSGPGEAQEGGVAVPGKPSPNIWTVMHKWIAALPTTTEAQQKRHALLQAELKTLIADFGPRPGLGDNGLVFAHNDLLSGNVIMLPPRAGAPSDRTDVTFIDYEYAVPAPAAFDLANHFAEWGGFSCDMSVLPTVSQRRNVIDEYIRTYASYSPAVLKAPESFDIKAEAAKLLREVDHFRGLPGFYWGIWALIQATISEIDFDYASYAETRLAEYWAWKAETDGSRAASGAEMPLRERRWAQETDESGHL